MTPSYSIAIQTFVYRFEQDFVGLLADLHRQAPEVTKIVFVNGQHREPFSQTYRRAVLNYISEFPNTYPIVSPIVRGCAFMWNTCCNFTDTTFILNLNDDVKIFPGFARDYACMMEQVPGESFLIHGFSAISIHRSDLFEIGYFDERLLGFGEEDGDWTWRWLEKRGRPIRRFHPGTLLHHSEPRETDSKNMRKFSGKYSAFNREWIYSSKYELAPRVVRVDAAIHQGMFDAPAQLREGGETPSYYPAERWYRENVHRL